MPYLQARDNRFFYQQDGQGPEVVLLHAVTSNLAVWVFGGLFEALLDAYRVTAYDLRGHGHSGASPTGYTSSAMAEDFAAIHARLGLAPAFLVGHSFGAVVATHAATLFPERVRGLVLADPYFPGLKSVEPNFESANVWHDMKDVFRIAGAELGESVDMARLFEVVESLAPAQLGRIQQELGPESTRWLSGFPKLARTSCGREILEVAGLDEERILSVRQPVALLYDEESPFLATCRHLEARLVNCRVEIVPGARHVAPLQNPEAFNRLVRQCLDEMRSSRPIAGEPG